VFAILWPTPIPENTNGDDWLLPGIVLLVVGVDGMAPKLKPLPPLLDIILELFVTWDEPKRNGCGRVLGAVVVAVATVVVEDLPKVNGDAGACWLLEVFDVNKAPNTLVLLFVAVVTVVVVELLEPNMNGVLLLDFSLFEDVLVEPKPLPKKDVCGAVLSFGKLLLLVVLVVELFPNPFPNTPPPDVLLVLLVFEKKDGAVIVVEFWAGGAIWLDDLENPNWKRLGFDVLFEIEPVENEDGILLLLLMLLFVVSFFWASLGFTNGLDKNDGVEVLVLFVEVFILEPNVNVFEDIDTVVSCLLEFPKNDVLEGWLGGTMVVLSDLISGIAGEANDVVDPKLNFCVSDLVENPKNPFELVLLTFAIKKFKKI